MKAIATMSLLVCFSQVAFADDLSSPSPSPTPLYLRHLGRPGSVHRMEQLDRRRELEAESQSRAATRAQNKANRLATAKAAADAKTAARDRERAQREVESEARLESARATPRANSDLMKRMGFSEEEITAQKRVEDSARPATAPSPSPGLAVEQKPGSVTPDRR